MKEDAQEAPREQQCSCKKPRPGHCFVEIPRKFIGVVAGVDAKFRVFQKPQKRQEVEK